MRYVSGPEVGLVPPGIDVNQYSRARPRRRSTAEGWMGVAHRASKPRPRPVMFSGLWWEVTLWWRVTVAIPKELRIEAGNHFVVIGNLRALVHWKDAC